VAAVQAEQAAPLTLTFDTPYPEMQRQTFFKYEKELLLTVVAGHVWTHTKGLTVN